MFPLKDNIPTDRTAFVTIALIAINVIVYFVLQSKGAIFGGPSDSGVVDYGAIPYEVTHPGKECEITGGEIACEGQPGAPAGPAPDQPPTLLTLFSSMFMHGGILHLAGNMLFLWIFGNNVEDAMGRVRFLLFYLAAGIAAFGSMSVCPRSATRPPSR